MQLSLGSRIGTEKQRLLPLNAEPFYPSVFLPSDEKKCCNEYFLFIFIAFYLLRKIKFFFKKNELQAGHSVIHFPAT
jgi:hypothetical protein